MLLRYLGPDPDRTPNGGPDWLEVGRSYDVAEIHEMPGWLMVRTSESADWPTPGQRGFQVDPFLFETPATPIEIRSCGYKWEWWLVEKFGVVFTAPEDVDRLARAEAATADIESPLPGETFESWRGRTAGNFSDALARLSYASGSDPMAEPECKIYEDVVASDDDLGTRFAAVYYSCVSLISWDVSRATAASRIAAYLAAVGVSDVEPRLLDIAFWRGRGGPRIINEIVPDAIS